MSTYFLAMMLLSGGSFISTRCAAPEMRPASVAADIIWTWIARAAFWMWLALMIWGFTKYHWSQPVAAVMMSLAVNAVIGLRGPMRSWPGLSMLFCLAGLMSGTVAFLQ